MDNQLTILIIYYNIKVIISCLEISVNAYTYTFFFLLGLTFKKKFLLLSDYFSLMIDKAFSKGTVLEE